MPPEQPPVGHGYMPPVPPTTPQKKGFPRGAKIAIIAGVSVLVIVAIVVVLAILVFVNVVSKPADVANSYMKDINQGSLSTAYGLLSSAAKADVSSSEFDDAVSQFKGEIASYRTTNIHIINSAAYIDMDVTPASGQQTTWYFNLVKEQGDWKILRIDYKKPENWPNS